MISTDWTDVYKDPKYQEELTNLLDLITYSLGQENYLNQQTPFIWTAANLAAVLRYFISNISATKDIDETPFLDLIRMEVGNQLPATTEIPLVEWIRENKSWHGHKSPVPIFTFIGDLIGSPIQIIYPKDLIFTLDKTRSCLDGASSAVGPLPFNLSKLARIEDSSYWSIWAYVVRILEFQNVTSYPDLMTLLDAVHPAGLLRLIELYDNYSSPDDTQPIVGMNEYIVDSFTVILEVPTLDNNWILDTPRCLIDNQVNSTFNIFTNFQTVIGDPSTATLDNAWVLDDLGSTLDNN